MPQRLFVFATVLAALVMSIVSLASCGPVQDTPVPPYNGPITRLPYRPATEVIGCLQFGGGYATPLLQKTLVWFANGLDAAPRANSGTLAVIVRYIDAKPEAPGSMPLAVTLPAIAAYPPQPTLESAPKKTGQPWKDAQNAQAVQQRNQAKLDAYQAAVRTITAHVEASQTLAARSATILANLEPPHDVTGNRVSIWGCVHAAALSFQAVPGDNVLVLATTANEESFADVSDLSGLKGARVVAINTECMGTASWCDWSRGTWQQVFSQAGVASQTWLDEGQTQVTSPAVVFDPQAAQTAAGS